MALKSEKVEGWIRVAIYVMILGTMVFSGGADGIPLSTKTKYYGMVWSGKGLETLRKVNAWCMNAYFEEVDNNGAG